MYKAIRNLYSQTESCVKLSNMLYTEWFKVLSGVRQGDSLSPTFFSLYINELAKDIISLNLGIKIGNRNISILLYADDMVLLAKNEDDLQMMLNKMYEWCNNWRLKLNEEKTKIVHFRKNRQKQSEYQFKYGNHDLSIVSEYKYLGVILDQHLSFESCSKTLAESGGRALGAIISKFKLFKEMGFNAFTKMFETGVIPVTDYGSAIWGFSKNNHAELIQNKAARYFLGVHNFTPIAALQGEMGWLPSKHRKYLNMLRFWNRLQNMPNDRLTKHVFNTEYHNFDDYKNWTQNVKEIFTQLNLLPIFQSSSVCDLDICQKRAFEAAEKEWRSVLKTKPKLRTYINFKSNLSTTDYVKTITNRYERSILAKYRCGILQLHIETGRFNNTKLEDRLCKICNDNNIENEYHFLCICSEF